MTSSLRRRAGAAAALVMVALAVALAVVAWREAVHLEKSERDRAMLVKLDDVQDVLNAARVAQRDFLLTSTPTSHAAYRQRFHDAVQKLDELRGLTQSNPAFSKDFARLERAALGAHTDLDNGVEAFLAGAPAAPTLAASEIVWRTLDAVVDAVTQDLRDDLAAHSARLSTTLRYTLPGLLFAFAVFAPVAAYGFVRARTELSAKRRSEQTLKATNAELDARVRERTAELEESERRFRQMAETIDDVFWIISADGEQLLFVSPAFERVWGLRCSDAYANRKLALEAIHPDDADRARAAIAGLSSGTVYDIEYRIRRPDGEERWINARGFPVRDAGGKLVLLTGVSTDITQRKIDQANLQAANRETAAALDVAARKNVLLRDALHKQAEFLARASHELKTPLNAVIGFSELLLSGFAGPLSEEQRQHMNEIYVAGEQLLARISDVLDLASSQSGDAVLAVESVDPGALVGQALESLAARAQDADVTVSLHAVDPLGSVALDPAKVTGLLRQVIGNAIKFTPAGGRVDVTLEVVAPAAVPASLERAERYLAIRISDTGVGMADDVRARLFAPFEQGDGALARAHGGLGIGLAIARHVARLHGGDIDIQSQPGAGTVVNVWFPIRQEPDAVLAHRPDAAGGTGRLALVIEDDLPSATLLERQLEGAGFEVKVAGRGLEGLDLARAYRPALILLDLMLPDVDGWTLLGRLTADPALASIPVVIVSAVADRERGRAGGAKAVIQKPFQLADLENVLAALSLERAA